MRRITPADAFPELRIRRAMPPSLAAYAKRSEGGHDCHFIFLIRVVAKHSPRQRPSRPILVRSNRISKPPARPAQTGSGRLLLQTCNAEMQCEYIRKLCARHKHPLRELKKVFRINLAHASRQPREYRAQRYPRWHSTPVRFSRFHANDRRPSLCRRRRTQSTTFAADGCERSALITGPHKLYG
jgi:hypothetical protein